MKKMLGRTRRKKLFDSGPWAFGIPTRSMDGTYFFMQLEIKQILVSDSEFEHCFRIRLEVFVEEQKVPVEEERDEYDETALHFLAVMNGTALGTARVILKDGGATAKIGRVAVSQSARKLGIGAALMLHIENAVSATRFLLDAQVQALPFYQRLGYREFGDAFMEAGIPHRHMQKIRT